MVGLAVVVVGGLVVGLASLFCTSFCSSLVLGSSGAGQTSTVGVACSLFCSAFGVGMVVVVVVVGALGLRLALNAFALEKAVVFIGRRKKIV